MGPPADDFVHGRDMHWQCGEAAWMYADEAWTGGDDTSANQEEPCNLTLRRSRRVPPSLNDVPGEARNLTCQGRVDPRLSTDCWTALRLGDAEPAGDGCGKGVFTHASVILVYGCPGALVHFSSDTVPVHTRLSISIWPPQPPGLAEAILRYGRPSRVDLGLVAGGWRYFSMMVVVVWVQIQHYG